MPPIKEPPKPIKKPKQPFGVGIGKPTIKFSFGGKTSTGNKPKNGNGKRNDNTNIRPRSRVVTDMHLTIIRSIVESHIEQITIPNNKLQRIELAKNLFTTLLSNTRIKEIIVNVDEDGPIYREIRILLARKFGLEPKDLL